MFHYGYAFNADKIKQLPVYHATTHPDMHAHTIDIRLFIQEIMYTGYIRWRHRTACTKASLLAALTN